MTKITSDVIGASRVIAASELEAVADLVRELAQPILGPEALAELLGRWKVQGLTQDDARQLACEIRQRAFAGDAPGEVVLDFGLDDPVCLPSNPVAAAAALDHLATRLGPLQRIMLNRQVHD